MRTSSRECWVSFVDWLGSGVSGILPETLRLTLGPVGALLPLARRAAEALGPWLLALLMERQRSGHARLSAEEEWHAVDVLAQDAQIHPLTRREVWRTANWLGWLLEGRTGAPDTAGRSASVFALSARLADV